MVAKSVHRIQRDNFCSWFPLSCWTMEHVNLNGKKSLQERTLGHRSKKMEDGTKFLEKVKDVGSRAWVEGLRRTRRETQVQYL